MLVLGYNIYFIHIWIPLLPLCFPLFLDVHRTLPILSIDFVVHIVVIVEYSKQIKAMFAVDKTANRQKYHYLSQNYAFLKLCWVYKIQKWWNWRGFIDQWAFELREIWEWTIILQQVLYTSLCREENQKSGRFSPKEGRENITPMLIIEAQGVHYCNMCKYACYVKWLSPYTTFLSGLIYLKADNSIILKGKFYSICKF